MIKQVEAGVLELPGADQQLPHTAKQSSGSASKEVLGCVFWSSLELTNNFHTLQNKTEAQQAKKLLERQKAS